MSLRTGTFGSHRRNSSRKASLQSFFGSAAVACLVLGCAWTVYSNILGASIYPTLGNADYDLPVVKRLPTVAARSVTPAPGNSRIARHEPSPQISAPATISSGSTLTFEDRFAAAAPQAVAPSRAEPIQQAEASPQIEAAKKAAAPKLAEGSRPKEVSSQSAPAQVALNVSTPTPLPAETRPAKTSIASVKDMAQRAKAAVLSIASVDKPTMVEKLWGKPQPQPSHGSLLSYASADASITGSLGSSQNSATLGTTPRYERDTAVYDISAHMVYLPDGSRLEAHSGLGSRLDDPRYANVRMHGPTPPHLYDLTPRESLFHGVAALRLNPVGGEEEIFGRTGLLAHTYMLGGNGGSNGCVSFRDYNAFLNAYRNQGIKRLAVVARVE